MDEPIIIIGGGAAGLMAAKELSGNHKKVLLLEASERLGGRIHTFHDEGFLHPVELGAEFIHGNLALTKQLLDEANIGYQRVSGKMLRIKNGKWQKEDDFSKGWDEIIQRMYTLESDMTVADFLKCYFTEEKYNSLRNSVKGFAEGFDLADIYKASVFALRDEWSHEDEANYRIKGGYGRLINYLADISRDRGCIIHLHSVVKDIHWKKNKVIIITGDGKSYTGSKVIITVSPGILQSNFDDAASIVFVPSITEHYKAAKAIGFGAVLKILLQFKEVFWRTNAGFILSNEVIPTWWTQHPSTYPLLTGWLGGPKATTFQHTNPQSILGYALQSLSGIFNIQTTLLKEKLAAWKVVDWQSDIFSLGGYSYNMVSTAPAKKILKTPVEETLFFAGEALYEGDSPGTVEAALVSGEDVACRVMGAL